jgi:hypothetical protein
MEWEKVEGPKAGPKMLFPLAWSLLPLVAGLIFLFTKGGVLPLGLLATGLMLSLFAVFIGAQLVPGRIDMLHLLVSPFASVILFFPMPEIVIALIGIGCWTLNYRLASKLSTLSGTAYRMDWDPQVLLPQIEGAKIFHRRWAARPLMRIDGIIIRGVREGKRILIEADEPIQFDIHSPGSSEE